MISKRSIQLFHKAAKEVPAYRKFLAKHNVNPSIINTVKDFQKIPLTDKKGYLTQNKLEDLVWQKDLKGLLLFCSTSGSTGEPYYFPRNEELSRQYSFLVEDYLNYSSYGRGRTLVIIGFGMGVWIGGVITLRAFEIASQRAKLPVAILPTGYNKSEIFKALKRLAPAFDQTVIIGYPPFSKEVIDEAEAEGVDFKKLNTRLMFAAEAFTETFRNYICVKANVKNPLLDTLSIYGTADIGAMAFETPLSILIRRLAVERPLLLKEMFRQVEKTPTLAQFNPAFVEFEAVNGEVVLTGNAALPLVRYAVGDHGGVIEYKTMVNLLRDFNINLDQEIKKYHIQHVVRQHPFVFVYERTDLSVSLHGITIYPEFIKEVLLKAQISKFFTERFTMSIKHDVYYNQFLQINIELRKGLEPNLDLKQKAHKMIRTSLIANSSEFAEISKRRDSGNLIQIVLWPNGHPRYFSPGIKQKWVEKS